MNTDKLKEYGCRFCKYFDGRWGELKLNECAYQWPEGDLSPENLPIAWELHPDIAEMVDKHNEKNTEAVKAKIRAATWKAFLQFEKYIESDDPITELKVKHDKFCTESGFLITDIAEAMQPETTERQIKCTHPRESRQYIGRNMLKCGICGYEFE